jgi:hypothetical protein
MPHTLEWNGNGFITVGGLKYAGTEWICQLCGRVLIVTDGKFPLVKKHGDEPFKKHEFGPAPEMENSSCIQ